MISRKANIIQKSLLLLSCIGYLICILATEAGSVPRIIFCIALAVTTVWHITLSRCPHCGRFGGIKPKPFAPDAGKCIHCGELVEYQ